MLKNLAKILYLSCLLVAGIVGIYIYQEHYSASRKIAKLEEEKRELDQMIKRLSAEKRVAEMIVTKQTKTNGVLTSELLFVEYGPGGSSLPAKTFTILGDSVHVDALVIKFDRDFVKQDDPLKGHSIALFKCVYGDLQSPAQGAVIDPPGQVPTIYQNASSKVSDFERSLWADFWRLAEDKDFAASKGVRVAQGEGPWTRIQPDRLYTLTLEAASGLNLTSQPLKGIYREALQHSKSPT